MSDMIPWIAAEAERTEIGAGDGFPKRNGDDAQKETASIRDLRAHQFPATGAEGDEEQAAAEERARLADLRERAEEQERRRRVYRGRTVAMLRRYMRYSIETGRLPSLLGTEFFRAKVTAYTVVTFEDRAIFVLDMERCLKKLDEFSRQLIARHILQEHDQLATSKLLHCSVRTVRAYVPIALDLLSEILLDVGLLGRCVSNRGKSCQGGENDQIVASDCAEGK